MKAKRNLIQTALPCAAMLQALTSGAQPVTKIAAGEDYSLFLKSDGSLWGMGYEYYGQLGDGTYNLDSLYPERTVVSNVTAIATGYWHSLFLKGDGSLWAMGYNNGGQLGDGTYNKTNRPEQIVASGVTAIAAGYYHSLFIKSDGSLWVMGANYYGQLGDGTFNSTNRPEQIVASNVTAIAAGYGHSLFIKSDGSLWAMGFNKSLQDPPQFARGCGQLGDGTYNNTNQPEMIVASNVTAIAAADAHSLFLKSDGSLWAMGWNQTGQLGDGTYNNTNQPEMIVASNVTAIAAGDQDTLFLESDGSLWAMGNDGSGALGDGKYIVTGPNRPEQIVASGVIAMAGGGAHNLFLKSDGSLWGMGSDSNGQLGDGSTTSTNRPEQILAAYNQITSQPLGVTNLQLSFVGVASANYALDRSSSLSPPNWIPQATNPAGSFGTLVFTNPPDAATNNFWRIRSVP
jgi:alpha-tubulin suppressor-like RCC1 family protein